MSDKCVVGEVYNVAAGPYYQSRNPGVSWPK